MEVMERKLDSSEHLLAVALSASVSGVISEMVLYPLDTLKTRLQSVDGFWRAGGFRGMYKGVSMIAIGSLPDYAIFFISYEACKQYCKKNFPTVPETAIHMFAGSIADVASCTVRVPVEVIKQRIQIGRGSMFHVVNHIMRSKQGWRGLYAGFSVTVMREMPYALIQLPIYEHLLALERKRFGRPPSWYQAAICGSISGFIAGVFTAPFDVVKTRMMLAETQQYSGMFNAIVRISREEGPRVLFSGMSPRLTWICLGDFFMYGAYEHGKKELGSIG